MGFITSRFNMLKNIKKIRLKTLAEAWELKNI